MELNIRNKVAESGIVTLDLAPFIPADDSLVDFDLKPFLFRELILKEKDYRAALQLFNWEQFHQKHVAIHCSTDAIIPVWAFMLAASYLEPVSLSVHFTKPELLKEKVMLNAIAHIPKEEFIDKRVVLKGCGDTPVPESAYVAATTFLRPLVKSLMYGEPCSTVPVYKKPVARN